MLQGLERINTDDLTAFFDWTSPEGLQLGTSPLILEYK